ncbi:hypothetical protein DFJ58DRAFT_915162 [Suillus subalutaceus]|uniref:uncharacterized protein n=1 Tax=Suillus subalutaceus TaxID=48586 RepID=UPI001B86B5D0|nr:uncharacterized protein DFJ58DRAFT_915162 [Suillus subalutaceus]KAG1847664.1 hypothetical protein DFJ58DRAFT_915162 [Suillus subalutaceus]
MFSSFNPKNLPFVGKGMLKVTSLTKARKENRDPTQEIDSADPGVNELDGDKHSTESDDTSTNTQPATSDSVIDTVLDGKSLPSHSFTGFMMISKGYAIIRRTLKAIPRNPQRMHSRKMQYHFSQAYSQTKASTQLSSTSTIPDDSTGPVCYAGPSIDHDLSTKIKTYLHIAEDDIPAAVSEPSGHPTECNVHVPDDDDDDFVLCKTSRCPRYCTSNHSVPDSTLNLSTTARGTRKTENDRIVDSAGEEEFRSHTICRFPRGSTSAPSSNTKTPSASKRESKRVDARLTNDAEEGTCIRKAYCPTQTPVGATSTDAKVSPNAAPFLLLPVVESARLPAVPIEHLGSSTESVAFNSPFATCQVDVRHVASSSGLIPSLPILPSTALHDLYSPTDGPKLLANNGISSLTSIFPVPFMNPPSYGAAFNSHALAFPSLPEQVLAEQPVSTFSGPSLSATTYDRFTAGPFCSGPFTSDSLDISSDYASFVTNGDVRAKGPLSQPEWIGHSDCIDVEMVDAVIKPTTLILQQCLAKPSAELNTFRPFLDPPPLDVTTAIHYACTYESPASITVCGGVSTAVSAVGPSSEEFSMNVEASYSQPAFDSTARHFPTDVGPSAVQSGLGHSSRWSSSILEAHSAVFSTPILERSTVLSGSRSTHSCSDPSEISLAEQDIHEITAREQEIQGTSGQANRLHAILENEYAQHASSADLKFDMHEHAASQSIPSLNTVIHEEIVVQPVGHVNDTITPVRRQPQSITSSAPRITGRGSDGKETQAGDDTKTEPDEDAKSEPDDEINEKDVNAEVLAHAILDIPLPPAIVASVQLLGQRKRRNSCCREGITRMRAKRRQMNIEESEEDGNGGIRAHRMRSNHLSRPSPYGSVPWRRKGHAKGHERWYPSSGLHFQASVPSGETSQTSAVESGDSFLSCSPFNLSIRNSSKVHELESTPAQSAQRHTTVPTSSRRRLRDEDSHYNASGELRNKERPLKQTRFKGCVEQMRDFVQPPPPPANPIPDKKRPPALRRATGYGSAGRHLRAHHPTNGSVQVRTDKLDIMRRARLATSSPASRHSPTNDDVMQRVRLATSSPTLRHVLALRPPRVV